VLLLQDLAVIPVLTVVNVLTVSGAGDPDDAVDPWLLLAVLLGAVAARWLLRPLLRWIAQTGIHELFTAAALALVIGAALAMDAAGLSMALGAFVAGLMVADSPYRHQLEADVDPFKGLLLGLFFMAVGMLVDLSLLLAQPLTVLGLTAALMLLKTLMLWPLARLHGLSRDEALRTALVLSQGGEFAFVLLVASANGGLIAADAAGLAGLVVTLSMAATPLLVALGERLLREREVAPPFDEIEQRDNQIVIAGFGRVGQIVARVLTMRHIPFTGLEINPHQVDFMRRYGHEIFYGDATRLDLLRAANVARARALVVAVGNVEASLRIVEQVRATCPGIAILARAVNRDHEMRLRELGVDFVLRETLLSSLGLATELLQRLGMAAPAAAAAVEQFRRHDAATLERQLAVFRDEDALHRTTLDAQAELTQLFSEDARAGTAGPDQALTGTSATRSGIVERPREQTGDPR
jgi:voltage-gated potassium channel Kch